MWVAITRGVPTHAPQRRELIESSSRAHRELIESSSRAHRESSFGLLRFDRSAVVVHDEIDANEDGEDEEERRRRADGAYRRDNRVSPLACEQHEDGDARRQQGHLPPVLAADLRYDRYALQPLHRYQELRRHLIQQQHHPPIQSTRRSIQSFRV